MLHSLPRGWQIYKISPNTMSGERENTERLYARSLLCYWAVRELGESMSSLARRLNVSTVTVSKSVHRGSEIAKSGGLNLFQFKW